MSNPNGLPDKEAGIGCHVLLIKLFSRNIWNTIWRKIDVDGDGKITKTELELLDKDKDGRISRHELRDAIQEVLGMSTHEHENMLVDYIMTTGGDINNDGHLCLEELNRVL